MEGDFQDLLSDQSLIKKILVKGLDDFRPSRSCLVNISYRMELIDDLTNQSIFIEQIQDEEYFLCEKDLISSIDIVLQTMNRQERSLILADLRHCYGSIGCQEKNIPPISSLKNSFRMKIDLTLNQWDRPPSIEHLSVEQRLRWGDRKRQQGNFYYRRKEYSKSKESYIGALRFIDFDLHQLKSNCSNEEKEEFIKRFILIHNNLSQVNIFLKDYKSSLDSTELVLKFDENNEKALFRRGKALMELGDDQQAIRIFQSSMDKSKSIEDIQSTQKLIFNLKQKIQSTSNKEKIFCRRIFKIDDKLINKSNSFKYSWFHPMLWTGTVLSIIILILLEK